jgi:hypothetical protein
VVHQRASAIDAIRQAGKLRGTRMDVFG